MEHSTIRSRRHRNPTAVDEKKGPFFSNEKVHASDRQPFFQPKLNISQPGDKYEREADAVAERVTSSTSNNQSNINPKRVSPINHGGLKPTKINIRRKAELDATTLQMQEMEEEEPVQAMQEEEEAIQMQEEEEELQMQEMEEEELQMQEEEEELQMKEEDEELQMKAGTEPAVGAKQLGIKIRERSGKGIPLPKNTRVEMEKAMGTDFGQVSLHTDANAVEMSRSIGAQAFTHGNDIYFNTGKFRPENIMGKRLLAHELTHVIQQGAAGPKVRDSKNQQITTCSGGIVQNLIQKQATPRERIRRRANQWLRSGEGGYLRDERVRVRYHLGREDFLEEVRQVMSMRMVSSTDAEREFAREMINFYGDVYEIHSRYYQISEGQELELVARIMRRDTENPSDRWILAIRMIDPNFVEAGDEDVQGDTRSIRERELIQLSQGFGRMAAQAREIASGDSHDASLSGAISVYCNNLIRLSRGERTMIPYQQDREFARPYMQMAERDWNNLTSGRGNPALYGHPNEMISNCRAFARQELSQHGNTTDSQVIESFVNTFNGYRNY
jgi:hypothetical protein